MTLACHRTCIIKQYAHAALVIGHESVHQTTSSCLITAGGNVLCRSSLLKVKQSAHSSGQRITSTHAAEYRVTISKVGWKYLKHENLTIAMKTKRQKKTAETTSYIITIRNLKYHRILLILCYWKDFLNALANIWNPGPTF